MRGENPIGEMVPNYSTVTSINRVYNSREAVVRGGGVTDQDVAYIESLITQGVSNKYICQELDAEMRSEPRKDGISQTKAMKRAILNIQRNLAAVKEAANKPREENPRI